MKKRFILIACLLVLAGLWWLFTAKGPSSKAPDTSQPSSAARPTTSAPASIAQPPSVPAGQTTAGSAAPAATPTPKNKEEMMQEIWANENAKPQDFYGKVVDQSGQPIEGATITGYLHFIVGMDADRMEKHPTTTDRNGDFELTGLKGEHLGAMPTKPGYVFKSGADSYQLPANGQKTSRDNRAIYTMRKLQGAEPMVHAKVHAYVPCDGTATSYDILTGHKAAKGDLVLTLTRTPVDIERGRPFDWKATVELRNGGGVIPINETYPNEAPAEGYEPKLTVEMPASMKGWDAAFERSYYFKSGKVYGRMTVSIQADFQPPPTSFDVEIYANPSGSRNLEFDPAKAIKPKQ